MSAHVWVTMACDYRLTERCLTERGIAPPAGGSAAEARRLARSLDWHRDTGGYDICPACWADRRQHFRGRLPRPRVRSTHLPGKRTP